MIYSSSNAVPPDFSPIGNVGGLSQQAQVPTQTGETPVLPPYPDSSHPIDFDANISQLADAVNQTQYKTPHKEVTVAISDITAPVKSTSASIAKGFGRSGAFIAGLAVAAVTKVVTFSSCLAAGGTIGLIAIPVSMYKFWTRLDEGHMKRCDKEIVTLEARLKAVELNLDKMKSRIEQAPRPELLKRSIKASKKGKKGVEKQLIEANKRKQKLIQGMEKQAIRDKADWGSAKGRIRLFHQAGMASAQFLEPLSTKLFEYALGKPNPKLKALNEKVDAALGKGGTALGVGAGGAITTTGIGIVGVVAAVLTAAGGALFMGGKAVVNLMDEEGD